MGGATVRWFAAMVVLGALLAAGVAFVVLRDYQPESALAGQRTSALHHAGQLSRLTRGGASCASCLVRVVGPLREHVWRVSVEAPDGAVRCFDIDNDRFALRPGSGVAGVRAAACPET